MRREKKNRHMYLFFASVCLGEGNRFGAGKSTASGLRHILIG